MEILVLRKRNKNICEDIKHLRFKPIKSINIYQGSWDWGEVFLSRFMFPSLARPVVQRIKEEEKRMKKGSKARAHFGNGYLIRVRLLSISERSRGDFLSLSISVSFHFHGHQFLLKQQREPSKGPFTRVVGKPLGSIQYLCFVGHCRPPLKRVEGAAGDRTPNGNP